MQVIFTLVSAALLQASADAALQPWASKAQPGDVANRHVEEISQAEHTYTVVHGGTVDGECCRTPMGCGINREGVTIDRHVRKLDDGVLGWGNEKVLSISTERVGSASQRFVVEVRP
jgi:hypothetical protein